MDDYYLITGLQAFKKQDYKLAFDNFERFLRKKDGSRYQIGEAYFYIGLLLFNNLVDIKSLEIEFKEYNNIDLAITYFERAAEYSYYEAYMFLFTHYYLGINVLKNERIANSYIQKYAKLTNQNKYILVSEFIKNVLLDDEGYEEYLIKHLKDSIILLKLIEYYLENENTQKALNIFKLHEDKLDDEALFKLYYNPSKIIDKIKILNTLVQRGNLKAKHLFKKNYPCDSNAEKIRFDITDASELSKDVDTEIADMYYQRGLYNEAFFWYLEYAEHDIKYAYYMIGKILYDKKIELKTTDDTIEYYFYKYIGNTPNLYGKVGEFYLIRKDYRNAYKFFNEGNKHGDELSMYYLNDNYKEQSKKDCASNINDAKEYCVIRKQGDFKLYRLFYEQCISLLNQKCQLC